MSRPRNFLHRQENELPEKSAFVRARVVNARQRQITLRGCINAQLDHAALKKFCELKNPDLDLFKTASEQHALSPRACHRILKVARTLADMDAAENIATEHLAEAITYRTNSRNPGTGHEI
jgi:magnesium chelatase family protein